MKEPQRLRKRASRLMPLALISLLSACGGGGGGSDSSAAAAPDTSNSGNGNAGQVASGSAVKGPLVGADIHYHNFEMGTLWPFDGLGSIAGSGVSDDSAMFGDIELTNLTSDILIVKATVTSSTKELVTNAAPILPALYAVIPASRAAEPVYPTPLTTLAYYIALNSGDLAILPYRGNGDRTLSEQEFYDGYQVGLMIASAAVGYGAPTDGDLSFEPPVIMPSHDGDEQKRRVASYRTGIEALGAVLKRLSEADPDGDSADGLLKAVAEDLSDGEVDGRRFGFDLSEINDKQEYIDSLLANPSNLKVHGRETLIANIEEVIHEEGAVRGLDSELTRFDDPASHADASAGRRNPDGDGDNIPPRLDNCPRTHNPSQADLDEDGYGDACDPDIDQDGVANKLDAFPRDRDEWLDSDGDGVGNNADTDDDNDGVADIDDDLPLDPTESVDTDSDGIGNNKDDDDDGDGFPDIDDAFPLNPFEIRDTDGDGQGDNVDTDADGDGLPNDHDNCPRHVNENQADTDGDGAGDACDNNPNDIPAAVWNDTYWNESRWQ